LWSVPAPQETAQGALQLWQLPAERCIGTKTAIYRALGHRQVGKQGGKPPEIAGLGGLDPMGTVFNQLIRDNKWDGKSGAPLRRNGQRRFPAGATARRAGDAQPVLLAFRHALDRIRAIERCPDRPDPTGAVTGVAALCHGLRTS